LLSAIIVNVDSNDIGCQPDRDIAARAFSYPSRYGLLARPAAIPAVPSGFDWRFA
jgi:hypothetical protein